MAILESTPRRLVLKSGSTTLTLDKDAGTVKLQRKMLIWALKPLEHQLADITDITIDAGVDRASGVEVCNTMVVMRSGEGWAMPAADKKDAEASAAAIRAFVGAAG